VPAHNEEKTIKRNLESIVSSSYKNIQLIIVNDSSTDKTYEISYKFKKQNINKLKEILIINTTVRGKAKALNKGLRQAKGSLFMCLDADSFLTKNALKNAISSFREKKVGCLSSNVKISPERSILNILQRIEYLICYQMKKAETEHKIQYIVGGIGSMYRMRAIKKLNFYETDTVTEDIDLSMKFLEQLSGKSQISYDPTFVVFTESVKNIPDLMKQRFRWKYGRYQVFLKRRALFFGKNNSNVLLSWLYLPYALFAEATYLLEPLTLAFIFYLIISTHSYTILVGSFLTFFFYTSYQVLGATQGYSIKERTKLILFTPPAYLLMYIISFVEYSATLKGIIKLPQLLRDYKSNENSCAWTHVARTN
jgi:cellulose synthase/poly-beta-1,6-N-acetylglucosamine synthase-like glycosyltransferase